MPEPIDYEKCRTSRTGLYIMVFLIMLSSFCQSASPDTLDRKLDEIKAMQPCRQAEVAK